MSFWNLISEFILFRWLFGHRNHSDSTHHYPFNDTFGATRYSDNEEDHTYDVSHNDYNCFLDEQDDYDMLDDDF